MPDDEIITEQTDEESAFEEDDGKGAPEKELEKKSDEEASEKESEEEPGKKPDKADDKKEPETAKDRLEKRIESERISEEGKETKPELKAEPEVKPAVRSSITKEDIANTISIITEEDLPEEVIIGDNVVDLKRFAMEFPDEFAAVKVLSSTIAERAINQALEGIKSSDSANRVEKLETTVAQLSFDSIVARTTDDKGNLKHPDYYHLVYGEGKTDLMKWVEKQPEKYKKLASSLNPNDGDLLLDYYKEDIAKARTAAHDKKTGDRKKELDDIHMDTGRRSSRRSEIDDTGRRGDEQDEAEAAFMEG